MRNDILKEETKRIYRKLFRSEQLLNDNFNLWLKEDTNDLIVCKCIACNVVLKCGKSDLDIHMLGLSINPIQMVKGFKVF